VVVDAEAMLAAHATQLCPRGVERAATRLLAHLDPDGVAPLDPPHHESAPPTPTTHPGDSSTPTPHPPARAPLSGLADRYFADTDAPPDVERDMRALLDDFVNRAPCPR